MSTRTQPAVGSGLRIEIERKAFESPPTLALEGLAFTVEPGEFVAIVGPSGAGKSTLLNIVAGLDRRYEGKVAPAAGEDGAQGRPVSYVFQTPRLMPWLTALENVRLVLPHETGDKVETRPETMAEISKRRWRSSKRLDYGASRMRTPASSREACGAGWRSRGRSA